MFINIFIYIFDASYWKVIYIIYNMLFNIYYCIILTYVICHLIYIIYYIPFTEPGP